MTAPWQSLLHWWFGTAESPSEAAKAQGKLWFGKEESWIEVFELSIGS